MSNHYLIFDITNLLYRSFFVNRGEDADTSAAMAMHMALMTTNKYFKQFNPDKVVMCMDRSNWRKDYTSSDKCVSGKIYKGGRRKNMSDADKLKFENFKEHLGEFEKMMIERTSVIVLAGDGLEADDFVAGFIQLHEVTEPDSTFTIVSSDKDLMQCLANPNVQLISPQDGKPRSLKDHYNDAEYFIFEKCMRGENGATGDNIQSALPKVRAKRLKLAFDDPYEMANLMNTTWTNQDEKEFVVKQLYNENRHLMDLRLQPDDIRQKMMEIILKEINHPGSYSYFHFVQFCGKHQLKKISQQAESFAAMLNC